MQSILSIMAGIILWIVFCLLKLPLPAPSDINGILWILWVFLGYVIVKQWLF